MPTDGQNLCLSCGLSCDGTLFGQIMDRGCDARRVMIRMPQMVFIAEAAPAFAFALVFVS